MKPHRLYTDENFPQPVADVLRSMGYDLLTVAEDGKAAQRWPDDLLLQRANSLRRVVITHDRRDFRRLHKAGIKHSGLVLCTRDRNGERLAASIDAALSKHPIMRGRLLNVYRPAVEAA